MSISVRALSRSIATTARTPSVLRIKVCRFPALAAQNMLHKKSRLVETMRFAGSGCRGLSTMPEAEPERTQKSNGNEEANASSSAKSESTNHAVVSTFDLFSIGVGPSSR
ncbi:hypothetical protein GGI22_007514 [Coemansia erecta]|nr:hypothetical protein GGI22_007514 [Coemansia erecta]